MLVGWMLVVLRNYVTLAIFEPYHDLEAGDNLAARLGIKPWTSFSVSQELNHYTTAAPKKNRCKFTTECHFYSGLQREIPMGTENAKDGSTKEPSTPKKAKSLASDKQSSIASQKKAGQGSRRESQGGSPKAGQSPVAPESPKQSPGSRRASDAKPASPLGSKPGSRPPTRGSATSKRSKGRERVKSEEDENVNAIARPRSEHEDPITQVEMETSEDEKKVESDRKVEGQSDKSDTDRTGGAKGSLTKSESKRSLAKGSSTQSLKKGSSTQSLKKGSSTQSLKKGSSTQSLKKAPSEEKVKRSMSPPLSEKTEQQAGQTQFEASKGEDSKAPEEASGAEETKVRSFIKTIRLEFFSSFKF